MRAFAVAWPDEDFVQGVLAQLPWYTHLALLEKLDTPETRRWYAQQALEHGWSRNVLVLQIEAEATKRTGAALTNFQARLPKPHSDLARESLKDPYRLDFLGLGEDAQERVVEAALVQHITKFLLELGAGFAFVGRQRVLDVNGDEFFIDLLFYHLRLRRYVVVELRAGKFKPEHLGQLGFYCTAIDAQVKAPEDQTTIGCYEKDVKHGGSSEALPRGTPKRRPSTRTGPALPVLFLEQRRGANAYPPFVHEPSQNNGRGDSPLMPCWSMIDLPNDMGHTRIS